LAAPFGLAGVLRSEPYHQVESGGEFASLGSLERVEGNSDEFLQLGITAAESLVEEVVGVLLFTLDVELSGEDALVPVRDCNMDVRCASGIGRRFDGTEVVLTPGAGEKASIALEVPVPLVLSVGLGMEVDPLVVYLPDLNDGIAERLAPGVHHHAAKVAHGTYRGSNLVVDDEEIIVGIEGKVVGIERPLHVPGRAGESLRQGAGHGEEGG
tara:strand:+ start:221 stop:856 length:636 start_codon:yes stop_codon:yes gene_type:complete